MENWKNKLMFFIGMILFLVICIGCVNCIVFFFIFLRILFFFCIFKMIFILFLMVVMVCFNWLAIGSFEFGRESRVCLNCNIK